MATTADALRTHLDALVADMDAASLEALVAVAVKLRPDLARAVEQASQHASRRRCGTRWIDLDATAAAAPFED